MIYIGPPISSTSCDFEKDNCQWIDLVGMSAFFWRRNQTQMPTSKFSPIADHIYQNECDIIIPVLWYLIILSVLEDRGFFLLIQNLDYKISGEVAEILSPPLFLPLRINNAIIKFYFSMYGPGVGSLLVYAIYPRYDKDLPRHLLWERTGSIHDQNWHKKTISFTPKYWEYQIVIRGTIGISLHGSIGLDDLTVHPEELHCFTDRGQYYSGTSSFTANRTMCKYWNDTMIYNKLFKERENNDESLQNNYCRNPELLHARPWCYIDSSTLQWGYCNISSCNNPSNFNTMTSIRKGGMLVRLIERFNFARVVVYHEGQWRAICSELFDIPAASVICRQSGLPTPGYPREFNSNIGSPCLRNFRCTGLEGNFSQCTTFDRDGTPYEYSRYQTGVICGTEKKFEMAYDFSEVPLTSTSCDFEYGFCGWHHVFGTNSTMWYRNKIEGKYHDYQSGTMKSQNDGHGWRLVNGRKNTSDTRGLAEISSPSMILPTEAQAVFLEFYLKRFGSGTRTLRVFVVYPRYDSSLSYHSLLIDGTLYKNWYKVTKVFQPQFPGYQIIIRSEDFGIAIDDIFIYPLGMEVLHQCNF
ncbi:uncharacterized protein TRIADDRAFT_51918 [Trichoplax adhaerens]|uniref:Neurotrypsin n=1 Tax=Trichoplax adhaerens TaxID=10228 RepID=B3RL86_TRIAD|nr:hypothetical protein TRIADDRAFT_51918 [Trichoplax adhaerens]EDV29502.1 hypothetical protein TRIADDRAFT_51918 [Trichoplax adhaerens]|eukprot:XP_002108704.1 hypothetical protein TRIADDRAFT_51918 [Trichoplax adhaerens]